MKKNDFNQKINYFRHYSKSQTITSPYSIIKQFESDRGRIINSAAIRRLQQKTQVFPLERNAFVRSRLTHSMEVQQVGRHIFKEILYRLNQQEENPLILGLVENAAIFESIVEMACLMHDIGNPPFGHFGEAAINHWFEKKLGIYTQDQQCVTIDNDYCEYKCFKLTSYYDVLNVLKLKLRQDLCHFDGNAQTVRLVHRLLKLNLTYSQISSIVKYTRPAYWQEKIPENLNFLMKKPGFYFSEESFIAELREQLAMETFSRYPMTYIMEAADDISYCIADLEDAVEKQILTVEQLYHYLLNAWGPKKNSDLFEQTVESAYQNMLTVGNKQHNEDVFFTNLRVKTIDKLVPHAAERFIENIDDIFSGIFNQALLAKNGAEVGLLEVFKKVGFNHIFNHESVENLELQGNRIIHGLFDIYSPLLAMPCQDFVELAEKGNHRYYLIESRLFHKLSSKYCLVYQEVIGQLRDKSQEEFEIYEFYYRCRLVQDYISGMTDHFAHDEYRKLMVVG